MFYGYSYVCTRDFYINFVFGMIIVHVGKIFTSTCASIILTSRETWLWLSILFFVCVQNIRKCVVDISLLHDEFFIMAVYSTVRWVSWADRTFAVCCRVGVLCKVLIKVASHQLIYFPQPFICSPAGTLEVWQPQRWWVLICELQDGVRIQQRCWWGDRQRWDGEEKSEECTRMLDENPIIL